MHGCLEIDQMANLRVPTGLIDPHAEIAEDVAIGPFCVIGPHVRVGRGTRLENHVTLFGRVTIGEDNHIFPNAVIGHETEGEYDDADAGTIVIGDHNCIREGVVVAPRCNDGRPTTIGNHNLVMACCHIGPSCWLGDHVSVANGSVLVRDVKLNDRASLSGGVVVHQGVIVGGFSFTSIKSQVVRDVPPFTIVEGNPARPRSVNLVGLSRNGFSTDTIRVLSAAYRLIFRAKVNVDQARLVLGAALLSEPRLEELLQFVDLRSEDWRRSDHRLRPAACKRPAQCASELAI
jgi:UDP-N-acetylglucosamine acyltransferase